MNSKPVGAEGEPLPLPASVKKYWRHLVPIMLFPAVAGLLGSRVRAGWVIPVIFCLFFATGFYAMWPTLRGRAKYSFWIFACIVHLVGGGTCAFFAALIANALFGPPA